MVKKSIVISGSEKLTSLLDDLKKERSKSVQVYPRNINYEVISGGFISIQFYNYRTENDILWDIFNIGRRFQIDLHDKGLEEYLPS